MIFTSFCLHIYCFKESQEKQKYFADLVNFQLTFFIILPIHSYLQLLGCKHRESHLCIRDKRPSHQLGLTCAFMTYSLSLLRPFFTSGFLAMFEIIDFLTNEMIYSPLLECVLCTFAFSFLFCVFRELPRDSIISPTVHIFMLFSKT